MTSDTELMRVYVDAVRYGVWGWWVYDAAGRTVASGQGYHSEREANTAAERALNAIG
jgi:hypothetical protein